jgi:hypothetical protein
MAIRQRIASIHLAGTIWFILCASYILIVALLQAGIKWWIVFSLSIHGILLALLLISLYLFAIFRGISSTQKVQEEHPITKTDQYAYFYAATPFLGGLAGLLGMMGTENINQFISGIMLGTLGTTFLVWVIVDPVLGLLEMFFPESRKYYLQRQAELKTARTKRQQEHERLLAEVSSREHSNLHSWQKMLKPQAERLAFLLSVDIADYKRAEQEAADIGVNAWQTGGLNCMRQLREMALQICRQNNNKDIVDYISSWWDGIGEWRDTSLC